MRLTLLAVTSPPSLPEMPIALPPACAISACVCARPSSAQSEISTRAPSDAKRSALAQSLSTKSAQPRYEAFLARAPSLIAVEARTRRGPALAEALILWERAQQLAGSAKGLSLDPHATVFELGGMLAALAPAKGRAAA